MHQVREPNRFFKEYSTDALWRAAILEKACDPKLCDSNAIFAVPFLRMFKALVAQYRGDE